MTETNNADYRIISREQLKESAVRTHYKDTHKEKDDSVFDYFNSLPTLDGLKECLETMINLASNTQFDGRYFKEEITKAKDILKTLENLV